MKKKMVLLCFLLSLPALAQESPSFRLTEHTLSAGGHPADGTILTSTSFRVTLDTLGEPTTGAEFSGPSYSMSAGFGASYPAPTEVQSLRFPDRITLEWDPEKSIGAYNLYRGLLSNLSSLGYGTCEQSDIDEETTTDTEDPTGGDGYFYLVTAVNRLDEEGTKGSDSGDVERPNPDPCP